LGQREDHRPGRPDGHFQGSLAAWAASRCGSWRHESAAPLNGGVAGDHRDPVRQFAALGEPRGHLAEPASVRAQNVAVSCPAAGLRDRAGKPGRSDAREQAERCLPPLPAQEVGRDRGRGPADAIQSRRQPLLPIRHAGRPNRPYAGLAGHRCRPRGWWAGIDDAGPA